MGRAVYLTIGGLLALVGGIAYAAFLFLLAWIASDSTVYGALVLLSLVAAAVGVPGVLTSFCRPGQLWLFPALFSASTLLVAAVSFHEPLVALGWAAAGSITYGLGYVGSRALLVR